MYQGAASPSAHKLIRSPSIHHIFNEKLTKRNSVQYGGKIRLCKVSLCSTLNSTTVLTAPCLRNATFHHFTAGPPYALVADVSVPLAPLQRVLHAAARVVMDHTWTSDHATMCLPPCVNCTGCRSSRGSSSSCACSSTSHSLVIHQHT